MPTMEAMVSGMLFPPKSPNALPVFATCVKRKKPSSGQDEYIGR